MRGFVHSLLECNFLAIMYYCLCSIFFYRFSRIAATVAYNEFIADRYHVHMNSTKWLTLTEFIKYLGREGKLVVEETERGLFITYVDRDPEKILKEEMRAKRMRAEVHEEERRMKRYMMQQSNDKIVSRELENPSEGGNLLKREDKGEKLSFSFSKKGENVEKANGLKDDVLMGKLETKGAAGEVTLSDNKTTYLSSQTQSKMAGIENNNGFNLAKRFEIPPVPLFDRNTSSLGGNINNGIRNEKAGKSALASIVEEQEKKRERENRKDYWLREDLVVKIIDKSLSPQGLFKKKGIVVKVIDRYVAEVEVSSDTNESILLRVDQSKLETVIPKINGLVTIVNGAYRGCKGNLVEVQEKAFKGVVIISSGIYKGKTVSLEYEDFCRSAK